MSSTQQTTSTMEPVKDIAILYNHNYNTPTSSCVAILTLQNGLHNFYSENHPECEVNPSLVEMCKEYDIKKKPLFFKVTLSEEKKTIDKIMDLTKNYTNYILDQIPLETVCHLLQMKHDLEMSRLKQDIKESLRSFKKVLTQDINRMECHIDDCVSDMYFKNRLL